MDNVTHTLAGLLLGEAAVRLARRPPTPRARAAAWTLGAVGANLPDADVLWTSLRGDPLVYLLHHRGHTHTVVGVALGALLLWAVGRWWLARRTPGEPAPWLASLAIASVASHLLLDWTNSYGVHPFWPLDDRWFYGDAVFIVEPWLWVAAVPPLWWACTRRGGRALLALALAAGLALAWTQVGGGPALALTLGALVASLGAWRLAPRGRVALGLAAWLGVEGAFVAGTRAARARLQGPDVLDVIVNPAPTDPSCASALVVSRAGDRYVLATASVAAWPALRPVSRCPAPAARGGGALPLRPVARPATAAVRWGETWDAPVAELRRLARTSCRAAALLRFARAPFWARLGPDATLVGDLRYHGAGGRGFADLVIPDGPTPCPAHVPRWTPPRAELLGPGG